LSRSRGSSGGRFVAKKDGGASEVPPNERMKLALERFGETPFAVGDSLVHKEFGPGTIETIKSLSGQNGRRAELRFEGKDKLYDLHLELCLYLELLNSPVGSVRGKG
ncbi:MAG: hypothetical protein ACXVOI_10815, partial [Tumebacillaceae bacterium]